MDFFWMKDAMPQRWNKAHSFLREQDKLLCLGAGYLLREVVGIESENEILFTEYGKPYAPGKKAFSISHSSELCAIATEDAGTGLEIGLDIEKIEENFPTEAKIIFTEEEKAWARDCSSRLYQLWTMKESVLKAVGMGFYLEPSTFSVLGAISKTPDDADENHAIKLNDTTCQIENWEKDGYSFSTCVKK